MFVIDAGKPSPIQITSDRNADAFSYTITWKKPITGGLPIEQYEIRYREVSLMHGIWIKPCEMLLFAA